MKDNTFTCAVCGELFEKGWSDEECLAELEMRFGPMPLEETVLICDDCDVKLMRKHAQ